MDLPKKKRHISLWIIAAILVLVLGFGYIFFGQRIVDYFSGRDYEPTSDMAKTIKNLELTDDADLILRAVHPTMQKAEEFNQSCPNGDDDMSALGCYSPSRDRIYIYEITSEELNGIKESVLAHELLHAIYQRMNNIERTSVNKMLDEYIANTTDSFGDYLSNYTDEQYYTELHSVVGQRIKAEDMPSNLREHYAKYFKDQNAVVGYYAKYRGIFNNLSTNIDRLGSEIQTEREAIKKKRENYQKLYAAYEAERQFYNQRLDEGYYRYHSIDAKQDYLRLEKAWQDSEDERLSLNEDINAFNIKVAEFNKYVEKNNALNSIVNSHYDNSTELNSSSTK